MSSIANINLIGFRTPNELVASNVVGATAGARYLQVAGEGASGFSLEGVPQCVGIEFGTAPYETPPFQGMSADYTQQISGGAPLQIEYEANGDHSVGYGRFKWDSKNKKIYVFQRQEDALISSHPRAQFGLIRHMHRTCYYRFYLQFECGSPDMPYPPVLGTDPTRNDMLFFQFKNDGTVQPPLGFGLVRSPQSTDDPYKRTLIVGYRSVPGLAAVRLFETEVNCRPGVIHNVIVDVFFDWLGQDEGGRAYLAINYNGQQLNNLIDGQPGWRGNNLYKGDPAPDATNKVIRSYIQIYRFGEPTQAPNGCGMTWHTIRCEVLPEQPAFHQGGPSIFKTGKTYQRRQARQ